MKCWQLKTGNWELNTRYASHFTLHELVFTTVKESLQIHLFMQNEPNFRKSQMNVSYYNTKNYEKRTLCQRGKNEPKTNPNEPNFKGKKCFSAIDGKEDFGYCTG